MSHFLLSVHTESQPREMSDEDMRRGYERVAALEREMRAVDALVYSGRLDDPSQARVVRPSKGRVRATDGPYAETKEQLGGFYIIDAEDLNAALKVGIEGHARDQRANRGPTLLRSRRLTAREGERPPIAGLPPSPAQCKATSNGGPHVDRRRRRKRQPIPHRAPR